MILIKDKYLNARRGTAKIVNVSCINCGKKLFTYQKDGPGWLKRCYLNRILDNGKLSDIKDFQKMKNLICSCGEIIGTPMRHKDKRLAFKLIRGKFKRTINKSYKSK